MVERKTANGEAEVCQLTGYACPKAAKKWLLKLDIHVQPGDLIVDKDLYQERVKLYNQGKLKTNTR